MTGGDTIQRMPTGINGFDEVALGGLPAGRCTLLTGTTGSGKTMFVVEFLARGVIDFDEPGVFVTFEERPIDIRRNAASMGFAIERWEGERKWAFVDASVDTAAEIPTVGAYDFGALVARVTHAVRRTGARRAALDSLGAILTRFADIGIVRRELFRIASALDDLGVTSVITMERTAEYNEVSRHGVEEFVLDNVIVLRNVLRMEKRRRTVEIVKFRGLQHRTGEWIFTIDPREGIVVIPLAFLTPRDYASQTRVSSGNAELDRMCDGGFFTDAIALVTGPTGTGKTLMSLSFAAAAVRAGERCLLCTFDETRERLFRNATGWGLDLCDMEASGLLRIISDFPEIASLEDHFLQLRRAIEEFDPARLVIDTLSALERIVEPRALLDFIIALGALLRQRETVTLLTAAPEGHTTPSLTPAIAMEIASLTDVTILLRYVERPGEVQRAIAVLQTRGSAHDQRIRQYTIDGAGMHIGEPLPAVSHMLPGGAFLFQEPQWPVEPGESG